ncbi:MAG: hypothetical protein ACSLE5_05535 [Porticoccaceae bacterium]
MTAQTNPRELAGYRGEANVKKQPVHSTAPTPIEKLLPRLDHVKETGPRKWLALCPAHEDKRPSLNVRELDDGTILVKCWSGCGAADVVAAVGLRLHHLFPQRLENRPPLRPGARWIPRDALEAVAFEALVVCIAGEQIASGNPLTRDALDRVALAAGRLRAAAEEVGCG